MTESLPADNQMSVVRPLHAVQEYDVSGNEQEPKTVIEQFLDQCLHSDVGTRAKLAEFVLAALKQTPENEWTQSLQAHKIVPDDDDYIRLMTEDIIYKSISELSLKTRPIVGHGNVLALERKALVELMELRAGQSLGVGGPHQLQHLDEDWNTIIDNLFKGWEALRS